MINALSFTLLEASLSAFFSVLLGVILARIWMRRKIWQRDFFESLIFVPFFLPPLFVVLAVIRFYGQQNLGWNVYGLTGIVLAHMILNIPLAFYMILQEWRRVPSETLAIALNLGQVTKLVERPVLRKSLPSAFGLIFLYASLSFTIVLTLGGGPKATTLELGIYEAIRFEFDLGKAVELASVQAVLGFILFFLLRKDVQSDVPNAHRLMRIPANEALSWRLWDYGSLLAIGLFLLLPIVLLIGSGVLSLPALFMALPEGAFLSAFLKSALASLVFAGLVVPISLGLAWKRLEALTWFIAAISPLVISTVIILVLRIFINPFDLGIPVVILVQVIVLCPVFVRLWRGVLQNLASEEIMVLRALTRKPSLQWRLFYWPRLRAPYMRLSFLALALAIGDLALYPLLAGPGFENLPMLIVRLMSSYRFDQATSLAVLVSIFVGFLLFLGQVLSRKWEI